MYIIVSDQDKEKVESNDKNKKAVVKYIEGVRYPYLFDKNEYKSEKRDKITYLIPRKGKIYHKSKFAVTPAMRTLKGRCTARFPLYSDAWVSAAEQCITKGNDCPTQGDYNKYCEAFLANKAVFGSTGYAFWSDSSNIHTHGKHCSDITQINMAQAKAKAEKFAAGDFGDDNDDKNKSSKSKESKDSQKKKRKKEEDSEWVPEEDSDSNGKRKSRKNRQSRKNKNKKNKSRKNRSNRSRGRGKDKKSKSKSANTNDSDSNFSDKDENDNRVLSRASRNKKQEPSMFFVILFYFYLFFWQTILVIHILCLCFSCFIMIQLLPYLRNFLFFWIR